MPTRQDEAASFTSWNPWVPATPYELREDCNKPTDIASAICGERSRQKQRSRNTTRRDAYRMVYGLYLELEELKALRRRRIIPGIVDKRL